MDTTQHTSTDFLCLTISAGEGKDSYLWDAERFTYRVSVKSDATGGRCRFDFHDSAHRHDQGIDQLDRENLLYAFRAFVSDAESGQSTFDDFCGDFGCDTDSRDAHRTWEACRAASRKFDRLFHDHREPGQVLEQLEAEGIA